MSAEHSSNQSRVVSPLPGEVEAQAHAFNGLGISISPTAHGRTVSAESFPGNTFGSLDQHVSANQPLLSPPSTALHSESTFVNSPYDGSGYGPINRSKPSLHSAYSYELQSMRGNSQTHLTPAGAETSSASDNSNKPPARRSITALRQRGWCSWVTLSTVGLALYSTVLSAVYVAIAFIGPHYGRFISSNGSLSPSTAAFLTSLFAKTIEMTFVTAMLAVLGQELSRRAYGRSKWKGVSIAEMGMRSWIVQPGTLISRWESVRYAGITLLGILSLIATLVATLYTPASTALVQPQLKMIDWESRPMQAAVKTSFSNPFYMEDSCKTPIARQYDAAYAGQTCMSLQHAASGYYNYFNYLAQWNHTQNASTTEMQQRPNGTALILENIVVNASWIENVDMVAAHKKSGLVINNVSLALPHAGLVSAARDPINAILQPGELDGLGAYEVSAGVPSPAVHVLCATLSRANLEPIVYELWDNVTSVNMSIWPAQIAGTDPYLNGTRLDTLFGWDAYYGPMAVPPIFPILPDDFETIVNTTIGMPSWGRDSIYILGKTGSDDANNQTDFGEGLDYSLCQLKISQTSKCSSRFRAAASGNFLWSHCEDPDDDMAYGRFRNDDKFANPSSSGLLDWPNVAQLWATSVSLNSGWYDGKAAISRLLTQSILRKPAMMPNIPSFAESLAVLAADTLLLASVDAPMIDYWNLTTEPPNILNDPVYQYFPAQVRVQQYASGGYQTYHRAFFPVLLGMVIMNLLALIYLVVHREWLVDLSEPQTLLSLAVSGPAIPSPDADPEANSNAKEWKANPSGAELGVGWAVKEYSTGVVIEKTAPGEMRSPLQGLRHRMSSHFTRRNLTSAPPAKFEPISAE